MSGVGEKLQVPFCVNLTVATVAKITCYSRVSWTVYKWEVLQGMLVYLPSGLKYCFCYFFFFFKDTLLVVSGILFGVMQPIIVIN